MDLHQALLPNFNEFLVVMRPPFEEGMCFDLILIVGENTAALGKMRWSRFFGQMAKRESRSYK
jgi:uncharacterized membrane protein YidH (DUF202 family)